MTTVRIIELLPVSGADPLPHLDPERVEHYRRRLDDSPPVVVFLTDDGFLLADGYHRVAAALREGREAVEADVRIGSRRDALDYAVEVGSRQRGLPQDDVRRLILERYMGESSERVTGIEPA